MVFLRSTITAAAICGLCLLVTAFALPGAVLNDDAPPVWYATSGLLAVTVLLVAGFIAASTQVVLMEIAAAAVAGGLAANTLVCRVCGGVADFIAAGDSIYSPGDLAALAGIGLLVLATMHATARTIRA